MNSRVIIALLAGAIGGGAIGYFLGQRGSESVRSQNEALAARADQLAAERDAATNSIQAKDAELNRLRADSGDLPRLRGEIGTLRRQTNELGKLREENRQLRASAAEPKPSPGPQQAAADSESDPQKQFAIQKINEIGALTRALVKYAADHGNQLPASLGQAATYLDPGTGIPSGYEMVPQGPVTSGTDLATTVILRSEPWQNGDGKWHRAYGFADGHAEIPGDFEAWERKHNLPPDPGP